MTTPARPWLAACVALAFAACGGNAAPSGDNAAGGAGSVNAGDAGSSGDAGGAEAGDTAAGSPSEGGAGGLLAGAGAGNAGSPSGGSAESAGAGMAGEEAGAGGAPSPVILPSGTHVCTNAEDCTGPVECRGRASSSTQVCLKGCASDADCTASHRCVLPGPAPAPDAAGCFLRCDASPLICAYPFDCYDVTGHHDYTCLPMQW